MIGHLAGAVPRPEGPAPYRRDNWRSEKGGELRRARQLGRPMTSARAYLVVEQVEGDCCVSGEQDQADLVDASS
jgi:hypothetical protein